MDKLKNNSKTWKNNYIIKFKARKEVLLKEYKHKYKVLWKKFKVKIWLDQ